MIYFKPFSKIKQRGFALISTILVMSLLMIIAVASLGISSLETRSNGVRNAQLEAELNARLSLMLAIEQLQSQTGQDTRVTASSRIINDGNVALTGAWRSWEGTDHDTTGKPRAPEYNLKRQSGDPAALPTDAAGKGRFLGWLASPFASKSPDITDFNGVSKVSEPGYIPMLSEGSVADTNDEIYIEPTMINGTSGAIAWWTSGDNSKAMINIERADEPSTLVEWQERVRSDGRADAKPFGLEAIDGQFSDKSIPSDATLDFVNSAAEIKKFHDLTTYSRGLITNTATGGWRKDMSLMSEHYSKLPATELPFFTLSPGSDQTYSKAQVWSQPKNPLIYPWTTYRSGAGGQAWKQVPPICSWSALVDYTNQYKDLSSSGSAKSTMPPFVAGLSAGERFNFQDQVRRVPQLARVHWIYSLCSKKITSGPEIGKYAAGLMITPVVTLWNPYNVELRVNNYEVHFQETAPLKFSFKVGTQTYPSSSLSEITKAGGGYTRFRLKIRQAITLAPGASRVFGLNDVTPKDNSKANNVELSPGYNPGGGFLFYGINKGQVVYTTAGAAFEINEIGYDATTRESGRLGLGMLYNINVNGATLAHRMAYDSTELGGDTVVEELYPRLTNKLATTVSAVEGVNNQPFASAVFGYRMVTPISRDPRHSHLYSKGMLQTNPLCYYTEIGFSDNAGAVTSMAGTGVYHPVNAPFDLAFQDVNGWNDTRHIPQFEPGTNSSYIVSGLEAGDGLTRCVIAEIPTRPLQSLAQLQHFDARNNNPIPPFQFNLIGNGSANPTFAPEQLYVSTQYNNGMCNDDTYVLNHMLFDDWFFSSISPDLRDFSSGTDRSLSEVYQDHLENKEPLPNRLYLPSSNAYASSISEAVAAVDTHTKDVNGKYAFETVASKLTVDGMFNINSVSLDAWKALLRQNRDAEIPYLKADGSTASGTASSFSYPRTSIAGDQSTDSGSTESNAANPLAVQYAGSRALTDTQVDALAEEIVQEIKKRGPFLSLSEFVNRQISTDKDLAIAGTIQRALDTLSKATDSTRNPYMAIQADAVDITSAPPGTTDYKFPEAALGSSAFGVPGWVRQADILTPIAPIITVRDDTFTIRAYGDSRDSAGNILAKAWCEATVQRQAEYVDPVDNSVVAPHSTEMTSATNKRFGRRYEIVSFRWLSPEEI